MEKQAVESKITEKNVRLQLENSIMQAVNQVLMQENVIDEAMYCAVNKKIAERRQPCVNTD